MPVTRSPQFDDNVADLRRRGRDQEESRMLACPKCAHATVDHSWSAPFDCLIGSEFDTPPGSPRCSCPGWSVDGIADMVFGDEHCTPADIPDLDAAFDRAWNAARRVTT